MRPPDPTRRPFQFSLGALFGAVTLSAFICAAATQNYLLGLLFAAIFLSIFIYWLRDPEEGAWAFISDAIAAFLTILLAIAILFAICLAGIGFARTGGNLEFLVAIATLGMAVLFYIGAGLVLCRFGVAELLTALVWIEVPLVGLGGYAFIATDHLPGFVLTASGAFVLLLMLPVLIGSFIRHRRRRARANSATP